MFEWLASVNVDFWVYIMDGVAVNEMLLIMIPFFIGSLFMITGFILFFNRQPLPGWSVWLVHILGNLSIVFGLLVALFISMASVQNYSAHFVERMQLPQSIQSNGDSVTVYVVNRRTRDSIDGEWSEWKIQSISLESFSYSTPVQN